ncbi:hypothetical protein BDA96_09G208600 [Sorghum bicolor]|uniref:O-methyltransferase ZRP4 n=2 Tax=Sorghum bicolor TaxID=4558 RepID=A0A921QEF0_SORBI|nr:hypothetical protein SORBI_3009G198000 [Sorghum bicolor]KAG0518805.1 hypothetical protein BDA96_09G208600 [Sorghum bicolor]
MALSKKQHTSTDQQAVLDAQLLLWHHTIGYVKSMALKAALDLRIPDAVHQHGGSATLPQIVTKVTLHPSKIPCLRRLMRVLTLTGVFSVVHDGAGDEPVYGLTPASRLLVSSGRLNVTPFLTLMLGTVFVSSFFDLGEWFGHELPDPSPFKLAHGRHIWDLADHDASFGKLFDDGMVADSSFIMDVVVKECSDVFQGISSLVDVAGGLGGATQTIAKAFPHVECSVLDLPHVVANAPTDTNVKYIAGDMFESIPSANAVFLKWILHDWGDAECVKILKNCKKAIASQGGKVVILDMVVGAGSSDEKHVETQILFDLFMMFINGAERDELEWKKIIFEAGFSSYKIIPVLGVRSIIEVYP